MPAAGSAAAKAAQGLDCAQRRGWTSGGFVPARAIAGKIRPKAKGKGKAVFSQETKDIIAEVARSHGIAPAALLAVAEVESAGRVFAKVDGRDEPLIRFEGHYFDRRLTGTALAEARNAGLSSPVAGAVRNPADQAARWALLRRAAAIARKAAYESTSWGLGQVMGAHWAWLGYADVAALVAEARSGAAGQTRLMARYIVKAGLADALAKGDWAAFARGYNGPNYRANAYDTKLAAAYRRHAGNVAVSGPATLRRGARGDAVSALQTMLTAAGYPLAADGIFGELTEKTVTRFQRDHRLAVDGIAGPATQAALRAAVSDVSPVAWLGARLVRLWNWLRGKLS